MEIPWVIWISLGKYRAEGISTIVIISSINRNLAGRDGLGTEGHFIDKGETIVVRELVHDPLFLGRRSVEAGSEDLMVAMDLLDTLRAHRQTCVGMAANMIGVCKRIIVFIDDGKESLMFNPKILKAEEPYETEEGCLSLLGGPRKAERFRRIQVEFQSFDGKTHRNTYTGWTAQIIQHEIDHCNGILI